MECKIIALHTQYDLFEGNREVDRLRQDIVALKESQDKVRKKLFAENGKLKKTVDDLATRLEIIERNICKNNWV